MANAPQVPGKLTIAGLGTGGLITAAAVGYVSQRHPEFLDFSRNVLDIAPLGIIVIAIGGAAGEGIRRLLTRPAKPLKAPVKAPVESQPRNKEGESPDA